MSGSAFLDLPRVKYVRGEVALPGSKSISNRVLLLAAMAQGSTRIDGLLASDDTTVMLNALQQLGVQVTRHAAESVTVQGVARFSVGKADLFMGNAGTAIRPLTAVLMAAPLAVARSGRPLVIEVLGELISKPYIDITLNLMARFGVQVERVGWQQFIVPADAAYQSPGQIFVEGDASSASYFLAMGALGVGPLRVLGVGQDSIQGDVAFADTVQAMGARVRREAASIEVSGVDLAKGERLKAFDTDFNLIPDAAMTAAMLALFADGPCTLRNIGSWRVKETDRITAMQTELQKLGAQVQSGADWLRVTPLEAGQWRDASIDTYDDHRMAMCFSLAAFGPASVRIMDPGCVSKTFPTYFSVFTKLLN